MASGFIHPSSIRCVTNGKIWPGVHVGGGSGSKYDEGISVMASLSADAICSLRWEFPHVMPAGQLKLRLLGLAAATSGNARPNPKWASVAAGESPSAATLNAEGVASWAWSTGDTDKYKEYVINLDADTPVIDEELVMDLYMETASWTLASVLTFRPMIYWG